MSLTSEVILCTYNGAEFVVDQLRSICGQTGKVDKISIYDDRSTDDTVSRIHAFVEQLGPEQRNSVTVTVNERNLGYAHNFAKAIANSSEDILFLCDQDDIWEPGKVEVFLRLFSEPGVDMAFSDGSLIDEYGHELGDKSILASCGMTKYFNSSFRHRAFELLIRGNFVPGSAAAIRRISAQRALPIPGDMAHDYWLAIWCSLHNGLVATPQRLYRYRQHQRNVFGGLAPTNPAYTLLGIWRQPNAPRERELVVWKAVTARLATLPCRERAEAAQRKLEWLLRVVPDDKKNWSRVFEITKSALDGSYRRHSGPHALLRDLVSLIK
jgi:glycosyltransferase involved in cell wall biosynthesis